MTDDFFKVIKSMQKEPPVRVTPIARAFGVEVYRNNTFPKNLSGLIKRSDDGNYSIHVNGNHTSKRQRFTIAHELAHFLLHKDYIGDGITDDYLYRSEMSNAKEREANQLAARILMPEHLLKAEKNKGLDASQLADIFDVSLSTMEIRHSELGLD